MPPAVATLPANPLALFETIWGKSRHIHIPHPQFHHQPHGQIVATASEPTPDTAGQTTETAPPAAAVPAAEAIVPDTEGTPATQAAASTPTPASGHFSPAGAWHTVTHVFTSHPHHPSGGTVTAPHPVNLLHHGHAWDGTPQYPNIPEVDIRETDTTYVFDIVAPSKTPKDSISIRWIGDRELKVSGITVRTSMTVTPPATVTAPAPVGDTAEDEVDDDNNKLERVESHSDIPRSADVGGGDGAANLTQTCSCGAHICPAEKGKGKEGPKMVLAERRVGAWERRFTFPIAVETKDLKVRFEDGVLTIWVEKVKSVAESEVEGEAKGNKGKTQEGMEAVVSWV